MVRCRSVFREMERQKRQTTTYFHPVTRSVPASPLHPTSCASATKRAGLARRRRRSHLLSRLHVRTTGWSACPPRLRTERQELHEPCPRRHRLRVRRAEHVGALVGVESPPCLGVRRLGLVKHLNCSFSCCLIILLSKNYIIVQNASFVIRETVYQSIITGTVFFLKQNTSNTEL